MSFKRFVIIDQKQSEPLMNNEVVILINTDHIVSIKPIRIITRSQVVEGYWIRTSNGKKYRALGIPDDLRAAMASETPINYEAPTNEEVVNLRQ